MKKLRVHDLSIYVFPGVYEPAEDTFLLLDAIKDLPLNNMRALDLCTGCGVIAVFMAMKGARVIAIDIDSKAANNAYLNALVNGVAERVDVICGDLCSALRKNYLFDLIAVNPPYLPRNKDLKWGGSKEFLEKLLHEVYGRLSSRGQAFIVESSINTLPRLYGLKIVLRRRFFYEEIRIVALKRKGKTKKCASS